MDSTFCRWKEVCGTKQKDYLNSLNQEQRDAVTAKIGPVRVLAGPQHLVRSSSACFVVDTTLQQFAALSKHGVPDLIRAAGLWEDACSDLPRGSPDSSRARRSHMLTIADKCSGCAPCQPPGSFSLGHIVPHLH
eukprot:54634-Pyramimonas_sp.AAC.1